MDYITNSVTLLPVEDETLKSLQKDPLTCDSEEQSHSYHWSAYKQEWELETIDTLEGHIDTAKGC